MNMSSQTISLVIAGGEIARPLQNVPGNAGGDANVETIRSWIPEETADLVNVIDWSHQPGSHYSLNMTGDLMSLLAQQVTERMVGSDAGVGEGQVAGAIGVQAEETAI